MLIEKIKMVSNNQWKKKNLRKMKTKMSMREMKMKKSFNKMTRTLRKMKNLMINQKEEEEEAERKDDLKVFLNF